MPRKDALHNILRAALEKEGWIITHDPLILPLGRRKLQVDLAADAPLAAERDGDKIAVEIKSFLGVSEVTELERAIGQYMIYRFVLQRQDPVRTRSGPYFSHCPSMRTRVSSMKRMSEILQRVMTSNSLFSIRRLGTLSNG